MWTQAGFSPELFWDQTPLHVQLAMEGVRKRLQSEQNAQTALAYQAGMFGALAQAGKLKPLKHYLTDHKQPSAKDMVAMLKSMGAKSDMKVRRIANDQG